MPLEQHLVCRVGLRSILLTIGCAANGRLRLDGSIDVRLAAGGYMSTLFWQVNFMTLQTALPFGL